MFQGGRHGFGLLLLRVATGMLLASHYVLRLLSVSDTAAGMVCDGLLVAGGVGLAIGFVTSTSSVVVAIGYLWIIWSRQDANGSGLVDLQTAGFGLVSATALAMLGPGAISIDSVLFGRREIIIEPD